MTDEYGRPLMRTGDAIVHGKYHLCDKENCFYCQNRKHKRPATKPIWEILNLKIK